MSPAQRQYNDEQLKRLRQDEAKYEREGEQGYRSNRVLQQRNNNVRHQFQDDIGGCSANYR